MKINKSVRKWLKNLVDIDDEPLHMQLAYALHKAKARLFRKQIKSGKL